MEAVEVARCQLCGKTGEDLTTFGVRHKEHGWIEICGDCWRNGFEENHFVAGSGGKSGSSCNGCSGCKGR